MPPEYCEFSACYADRCKPWLEKHHPELLRKAAYTRGPDIAGHSVTLSLILLSSLRLLSVRCLAESDVTAKVATLSVEEKKDTEEKKDSKADKKAADKKKAKPANDEDDEDEEDEDEDDDEGEAKPKGSAAAAIRSKGVQATGVFIRKEQRSKHKYITSVKGMDAFGCDLKKAAKAFSKKYATNMLSHCVRRCRTTSCSLVLLICVCQVCVQCECGEGE